MATLSFGEDILSWAAVEFDCGGMCRMKRSRELKPESASWNSSSRSDVKQGESEM